jgi:predicted phage tail protein
MEREFEMADHGTKTSNGVRLWHAAREHVSNAVIGGLLIALTGFAPEHWVAEVLPALHIDSAFKSWPAGLDPLAVVALGVAIAVSGVLFRRQK